MSRLLTILLCGLISLPVLASEQEISQQRPLLQVDVFVEMEAINESLDEASRSIGEISNAFRVVAEGGQLDAEQQQQLVAILENLDHVVEATRASVDALPELVRNSRQTVTDQVNGFFSSLKFWSIAILIILGIVLIAAIICFYYFVLQPLKSTLLEATGNIANMAKAMENTSRSLEVSNQTHREMLKLHKASGDAGEQSGSN